MMRPEVKTLFLLEQSRTRFGMVISAIVVYTRQHERSSLNASLNMSNKMINIFVDSCMDRLRHIDIFLYTSSLAKILKNIFIQMFRHSCECLHQGMRGKLGDSDLYYMLSCGWSSRNNK